MRVNKVQERIARAKLFLEFCEMIEATPGHDEFKRALTQTVKEAIKKDLEDLIKHE